MVLMCIYILPVLLAIVFIPNSIDSTTVIETDAIKTTITENTDVEEGVVQKSRPENVGTKHKHRHRKIETDDDSVTDEVSAIEDKATSREEMLNAQSSAEVSTDTHGEGNMDIEKDVVEVISAADKSGSENEEFDIAKAKRQKVTDHSNEKSSKEADDKYSDSKLRPEAATEVHELAKPCPKCTKKTLSEKEIKIEMVKSHLLQKLGLSSAPKVDSPIPPLPFDFYVGEDFSMNDEAEQEEEEKRRTVRTREIFVYGKDITDKCAKKRGVGCYSFNTTSPNIDPDLISSIELWIYKQPDVNDKHIQEFMVSELQPYIKGGKEVLRFRNIVKRVDTRLKYGWMKIYVRRSVIRWLSKPHKNHGLAVVCKTCKRENHKTIFGNKEGYMPILVFYMRQNVRSHKRVRRQTQCREGGLNCCHKEELEINFHDIGWDYIMTPQTIRPNFCTGSCNGVRAAYYNHTRLMQTVQQSVLNTYAQIETCCSPVSFSRPQSLLYRDHEGNARKVDVPDLIVGECGCT